MTLPPRQSYHVNLIGYGLYGDVYKHSFTTFTPDEYFSLRGNVEHIRAYCSTKGEEIIRVVVDVRM